MGRYGVEAEFFGMDAQDAAMLLRDIGVETLVEDYNHRTREHWKIVEDSSVSAEGNELVSPILETRLPTHTTQVRKAFTTLRDNGGEIDRSCGLHVHHDASSISTRGLTELVGLYALYQDVIDSILAPSRRSPNAQYTRSLVKSDYLTGLDMLKLWEQRNGDIDLDKSAVVNRIYWGDRYTAVNLQSLENHGTVEFRQHGGTLNAKKAGWWVRLTGGLMRAAASTDPDASLVANRLRAYDGDWASAQRHLTLRSLCTLTGLPAEGLAFFRMRQAELKNVNIITKPFADGVKDKEDVDSEEYADGHYGSDRCRNCHNWYDECRCCGSCGARDRYDCGCCIVCEMPECSTHCQECECLIRSEDHSGWCSRRVNPEANEE